MTSWGAGGGGFGGGIGGGTFGAPRPSFGAGATSSFGTRAQHAQAASERRSSGGSSNSSNGRSNIRSRSNGSDPPLPPQHGLRATAHAHPCAPAPSHCPPFARLLTTPSPCCDPGAQGQSTFGTTSNPFGAPAASANFGAPAPTPAFGGGFGARPAVFGAGAAPTFGATPAASPFGAAPAASPFGAAPSPFGGAATSSTFGGAGAPSPFGGGGGYAPAPAPAVGFGGQSLLAPQPAAAGFGGGAGGFGGGAGGFGGGAGGFGGGAGGFGGGGFGGAAAAGTGNPPYKPVQEREQVAGAPGQVQVYQYCSITKMPQYEAKSFEELRFEDYAKGANKPAVTAPFAGPTAFGAVPSPFGVVPAPAAAPNPFGAPNAFGAAPKNAFGAPAAAMGPFGAPAAAGLGVGNLFGAAPAPFGAAPAPAPFGNAPAPFGAAQPNMFGAAPPAFAPPAAPFGAPLGGGGFGAAPQPAASQPFGLFGAAPAVGLPPPMFAPAKPGAPANNLFGAQAAPMSNLFGAAPAAQGCNPFATGSSAPVFPGGGGGGAPAQVNTPQLPPAPSTNPYPYGRHALFAPVLPSDPKPAPAAPAPAAAGGLFSPAPAPAPASAAGAPAPPTYCRETLPLGAGGVHPSFIAQPYYAPITTTTMYGGAPSPITSLFGGAAPRPAPNRTAPGTTNIGNMYGDRLVRKLDGTTEIITASGEIYPTDGAPTLSEMSYVRSALPRTSPAPSEQAAPGGQRASLPSKPLVRFSPRALDIDQGALVAEAARGHSTHALETALEMAAQTPSPALGRGGDTSVAPAPANGHGGFVPSRAAPAPAARSAHILLSPEPAPGACQFPTPATREGTEPLRREGTEPLRPLPIAPNFATYMDTVGEVQRGAGADEEAANMSLPRPLADVGDDATMASAGVGATSPPSSMPTPRSSLPSAAGAARTVGLGPPAAAMPLATDGEDEGYEVRPFSMARLRAGNIERVMDLEVRRRGFGTLFWEGLTDVRGLVEQGLREIITMEQHWVEMYRGSPPPKGEGLNRECKYTMENLWPRGPSNEILTDERAIGRFEHMLHQNAERMKARMVRYDPECGEWTVILSEFLPPPKSAQAGRQAR